MEPMDSDCIVTEELGNDSFKWDTETTRLLLTEYKKNMGKIGKHPELLKKKDLWLHITAEINNRGLNLTLSQVRNRMTTLDRAYKRNMNRKLLEDPALDQELKEIMASKPYTVFCASMLPDDKQQFLIGEHQMNNSSYTDQQSQNSTEFVYESFDNPTDLYKWDFNTTRLLFDMYDEVNEDANLMKQFKTKSSMWNSVTEKLNAHGYIFSSVQVQNRIKTIERAFRRHMRKVKNGKNNEAVHPFPFENRIKKIIKKSYCSIASMKFEHALCEESRTENDMFEDYDDIANIIVPHVVDEPKTEESALLREIKLLRQEESQFRKEVQKMHKEKINALQQGNALLRENNNLLRQVVENTKCSSGLPISKDDEFDD